VTSNTLTSITTGMFILFSSLCKSDIVYFCDK
jgi:hypothetical protein